MTETEQKPSQPEEGIEQSIELWKNSIVMFAALLLGALMGYFWIYVKHLPPDLDPKSRLEIGDWGAFGDFMGGLMNPIVAFAALYWLTQSVKLQKTELAKTQKALDEAANAQAEQARNGRISIQLAAATAIVNTLQLRIDSLQQQLNIASPPRNQTVMSQVLDEYASFTGKTRELKEKIEKLESERDEHVVRMSEILKTVDKESLPEPVRPKTQ